MRRHSPPYYSPPRRGYTGRGRSPPRRVYDSPPRRIYDSPPRRGYDSPPRRGYDSPPRRGYGSPQRRGYGSPPRRGYGGFGRNKEQNNGSLLVRNIPLDCRPEELRVPFERFGLVRDVYLPKDYYTGEPRGFAFVQFVDPYDAAEAQYHMNGQIFAGREISVVVAAETRKRPEDMRKRTRISSSYRGPSGYGGRRSSYYGRSRSRSLSRSRSPPRHPSGSRSRHRSRSYSPGPRGREGDSISPDRRQEDLPRSPRDLRRRRETNGQRNSYSPGYDDGDDAVQNRIGNSLDSRSPSGSRSRSAD